MTPIFPGMDPYLEDPAIWPGVHARFIVYLAEVLRPLVGPRSIADVEQRVYVEGPDREVIPDVVILRNRPERLASSVAVVEDDAYVEVEVPPVEVRETYVVLIDRNSGDRVVATIELVSPTNKYAGPGRASYLRKQREVLASDSHRIEIDLLRGGPHVLAVAEWAARSQGD